MPCYLFPETSNTSFLFIWDLLVSVVMHKSMRRSRKLRVLSLFFEFHISIFKSLFDANVFQRIDLKNLLSNRPRFRMIYQKYKTLPPKSGLTFCGHEINCHLNLCIFFCDDCLSGFTADKVSFEWNCLLTLLCLDPVLSSCFCLVGT